MTPRFFLVALLGPLVIPVLVFLISALTAGMTPGASLTALAEQCAAPKHNPLRSAIPGYFPIVLLLAVLLVGRRFESRGFPTNSAAWGGLLPILAVLVWVNFEFWSGFLPTRVYAGWPHGLELIIGPGLFAPIAMAVGVVIAWIAGRARA